MPSGRAMSPGRASMCRESSVVWTLARIEAGGAAASNPKSWAPNGVGASFGMRPRSRSSACVGTGLALQTIDVCDVRLCRTDGLIVHTLGPTKHEVPCGGIHEVDVA